MVPYPEIPNFRTGDEYKKIINKPLIKCIIVIITFFTS